MDKRTLTLIVFLLILLFLGLVFREQVSALWCRLNAGLGGIAYWTECGAKIVR